MLMTRMMKGNSRPARNRVYFRTLGPRTEAPVPIAQAASQESLIIITISSPMAREDNVENTHAHVKYSNKHARKQK